MLYDITPQMRLCDFEQPATFANVNQHIFRRMKTKNIFAFTVAAFLSVSAFAVGGGAGSATFTVKTSKVGRSLVEAWTKAYMAEHPEVNIQIVGTKAADADLTLINHKEKNQKVAYVARYALLPVTTSGNPLLGEIDKKSWGSKDLKELFFTADELDDDFADDDKQKKGKKITDRLNVVSGANSTSSAPSFAAFFGRNTDNIKGEKIAGDDLYLLSAINDDKTLVTFNSLNYLYDTDSRQLKSNLHIFPLNVKKEIGEALKSGNLDEVLGALETQKSDVIPVENIGFEYENLTESEEQFLKWVASEGQQFNNQNGFLKLADNQ